MKCLFAQSQNWIVQVCLVACMGEYQEILRFKVDIVIIKEYQVAIHVDKMKSPIFKASSNCKTIKSTNSNPTPPVPYLSKQLLPLLHLLRILGRCPLNFDHRKGYQIVEYGFNPLKFPKPIFSCFLSAFLLNLLFIFGILQFGSIGYQAFPTGGM